MRITSSWLKKRGAYPDFRGWFNKQKERDSTELVNKLLCAGCDEWARWLQEKMIEDKYK